MMDRYKGMTAQLVQVVTATESTHRTFAAKMTLADAAIDTEHT